jgi:DNA-binding NarL/FixJ family response regulator
MKLLIVYRHRLFRESLRHLLKQLNNNVLVLEASNFNHALDLIHANPDLNLVLLDLNVSDINGFDALDILKNRYTHLSVVALSDSEDYAEIRRAIAAGAQGFISKSYTGSVLVSTLLSILTEKTSVPPAPLTLPANSPRIDASTSTITVGSPPLQSFPNTRHLTRRQRDVLALLKHGKTNKEIARSLRLAEGTVKSHCMAIFRELRVNNRTEAALRAKGMFPLNS